MQVQSSFADQFLHSLVDKLGTCFTTPEEVVLKQGEEMEDMYWIQQGDCAVNIKEHDRQERVAVRLLVEGDHFGEIGMMYKCKRTASVISRNYNTMARLSYYRYRDLVSEFPEFKKALKKHTYKYNFKKKQFLFQIFNRIEYL